MKVRKEGNPLFEIAPKTNDGNINMLVEIPTGSNNKYEFEVETGRLILDRVIYEMLPYPVEYGLIPQTWDEDEDMLDVMALTSFPTFPGCQMEVRLIGVMEFIDSGEVDDKILAVPAADVRFQHIQSINDLPDHKLDEIGFFFSRYKELQFKYKKQLDKSVEVKGFSGIERANEIFEKAQERFKMKFA